MAASVDKFARLAALRPAPSGTYLVERLSPEDSPSAGVDECTLAKLLGATIASTKFGNHLSIRNWHATPEYCEPSAGVVDLLGRKSASPRRAGQAQSGRDQKVRPDEAARSKALENPEKWLFMDTETTGLAGGTGTYAFLVGIAWWDSGGLQVEQFLMRDFSEEHSLLVELAARIRERPVLVTFNGKSFDWPLLESRYLMTRNIRVPELAAHLDLLHPARAVWKLRLGSVRLVELERHVLDAPRLGWHREDDVPSSLIPQFYFDYLRGGSPGPLAGVVQHNRMDLRGLAALFGKLNSLLSAEQREETEALDLFGLSRYLQRRGEATQAESACVAARGRGLPVAYDAQAQRELALMAKRRGEHAQAAEIWQELLQDGECHSNACEELAIYYERRAKDFTKALEFAWMGLNKLRKRSVRATFVRAQPAELRRMERLMKRVARLEKRLNTLPGADSAPLLRRARATAGGT
jgi:uncharacterized protein YprB with RNaseH-like and TPR domain